jgi:predicted acylesterase/phospholipase RssA
MSDYNQFIAQQPKLINSGKDSLSTLISKLLVLIIILLFVASCATKRPAESAEFRNVTPTEAVAINDEVEAGNSEPFQKSRDRLTILALSGGSADGAYGVGVLNGWTKTGTRPKFDIVTGSSTGALISIFAFLGPKYDKLLKDLYLSQTNESIFRNKGFAGYFSESLFDNEPLKKQIEKIVTEEIVDEIAREHKKGRRLYIATTNLDAGELVVWDMGLVAASGADGRSDRVQFFQKILRASAAIPVFFPPVFLKPVRGVQLRQAHADGGIKAPVLLSDFLFDKPAKKRDLYIIINGSLNLEDANEPVELDIQSIAAKSLTGITRELTQQIIFRGYVRANNTNTSYNLTAIPNSIPTKKDALSFDSAYLRQIYTAGETDVQEPGFWWKKPPTLKINDQN